MGRGPRAGSVLSHLLSRTEEGEPMNEERVNGRRVGREGRSRGWREKGLGAQRASHPRLAGEPREEGHAACVGPDGQEEAGAVVSSFCEQWGLDSRALRVGGEAVKTACRCVYIRVYTYACVCKL